MAAHTSLKHTVRLKLQGGEYIDVVTKVSRREFDATIIRRVDGLSVDSLTTAQKREVERMAAHLAMMQCQGG